MEPSMGAEDFSFMLQKKPGAYLRIGQGVKDGAFLHNSRYDFNDEILPLGAAMHASLIEQGMPLPAGRPMENAKAQASKLHASSAAH
jgi:metal-dependent amidase/aminoacylase/carboxypeptidase family protein